MTEPTAAAELRRQRVIDAVDQWRGQLIDLGGRNQLLHYRDLKVGTLDLAGADPAAVDALLAGRTVTLSRLFDEATLPGALKRARAVRNKAREATEERGISILFLASGMATWTNTRTASVPAAPVLLREAALTPLGVSEDDFDVSLTGETDVNPTLLHLLEETFSVTVSEEDLLDVLDSTTETSELFKRLMKAAASVPGFSISHRQVIGTFSYAKLPMVVDLTANLEALIEHDVIAAIAGDHDARAKLLSSGVTSITPAAPDNTPPSDEFLVLDADSSQNYAINQVVSGASLVIKGPPGTGKSQTISNLIATMSARGQKVLFVAEKRAAIDAVLERLHRAGLSDLVLDLHEGVGSKRKVAQNLAAALQAAARTPALDYSPVHERLVKRRTRLSDHSKAINEAREPWQLSVADAYAKLIGLHSCFRGAATTELVLPQAVLSQLTPPVRRDLLEALDSYARLGGLHLTLEDSPWIGAHITSAEQAQAAFDSAQRLSSATLPRTRSALAGVLTQTGLRSPASVEGWTSILSLLDATARTLTQLDQACFAEELDSWAAGTATRSWRKSNAGRPGVEAGWRERRRWRKQARASWTGPDKPKSDVLHRAVVDALGIRYAWSQASADGGLPRLPGDLPGAAGAYQQLGLELAALGAYLSTVPLTTLGEDSLAATVSTLATDEATLRKVPRLNELRSSLYAAGLGQLVEELKRRKVTTDVAVAAFEECFYRSLIRKLGFEDQLLAGFDADEHSNVVAEFIATDEGHIRTTGARVRRAAAERLIAAQNEHPEQEQLVKREAAKKQQHLPLRQLFSMAPDVMTAVKPCWAMSPLVVSQLLPGDRPYFDVVIFDEASQIVPADAVPAILRARKVVVAGDEHQLPPTNFFASASDGTGGDGQVSADDGSINLSLTTGFESVLDVMNAFLPVSALRWHYRSHDERLIAFSNAWIYDRSLVTFPGIAGAECLAHVLVPQAPGAGQEDSASAEVTRVVELALLHAEQRPRDSLGVIAMGIKHADRLDTALRRALVDRPDLHGFFDESRKERFFVKNLERVQGDERDAIILSVGYGKSANGSLPHRFGPLNQAGGERRLNVAITRARSRMTVVSSFDHHDMVPDKCRADGAKLLRAFLEYAASGGTNLGAVLFEKPALNPFEIDVRDRLTAAGIPLTAQYGVSGYRIDFAAAHPVQQGRMVLAIEADGASYHSSETARDRDRLRQQQLERMGWTFHRIWSTAWFHERNTCIAAAVAAYQDAVDAYEARQQLQDQQDEHSARQGHDDLAHHMAAPVVHGQSRGPRTRIYPGSPITDYSDEQLGRLIRWINSDTLLRSDDEVFEIFVAELGFQRRGSRIRAAFERAIPLSRK